jgi:hypothetical protein
MASAIPIAARPLDVINVNVYQRKRPGLIQSALQRYPDTFVLVQRPAARDGPRSFDTAETARYEGDAP